MIIHQGELFAADPRFHEQIVEAMQRQAGQPVQCSMNPDDRPSLITQLPIGQGVAVIRVSGCIQRRESWWYPNWDTIVQDLKWLDTRPNVNAVVLLVDSGGGIAMGCQEACDAVEQFSKPIVAFVEGYCCSAAYRLVCYCDAVYATKSAQLGSLGTMVMEYDYSEYVKSEGIRPVAVSTGPIKTFGAYGLPITEEQQAFMQELVGSEQAGFIAALQVRGLSAEQQAKVTDGRYWPAAEAQQLGLIDGVKEVSEVISSAVQLVQSLEPVADTEDDKSEVEQSLPVGSEGGSASMKDSTSQPAAKSGEQAAQVAQGITTGEIKQLCTGAPAEFILEQFEACQSIPTGDARVKVLQAFSVRQQQELEEARKAVAVKQAAGTAPVGSTTLSNAPAAGEAAAQSDVIQQFEGAVEEKVKQLGPDTVNGRRVALAQIVQEKPELHKQYLAAIRQMTPEQVADRRRRSGRFSAEFMPAKGN